MINAACDRVSDTANQGYYPLSWQVIAQMTLNGEVAKAGAFFNEPTESPTKAPTIPEGCYSINYMDCLPAEISNYNFCNKIWLPAGAQDNCAPLGEECSNVLSCCGPAECVGDYGDTSCLPPTDTPNSSPTKAPTIPEGCYSMNYMDCLPAEISDHDFCNKIWLPAGAQDNCAPLGGECSNVLSCCGPAECVGDYGDTSCLPPTDTPNTSPPTKAPSSAPSSSCVHCDNVGTNYMIENGKDCTAVNLGNKCIKKNSWISNKFCQLSCYGLGLGYEGDVCCNGEAVN